MPAHLYQIPKLTCILRAHHASSMTISRNLSAQTSANQLPRRRHLPTIAHPINSLRLQPRPDGLGNHFRNRRSSKYEFTILLNDSRALAHSPDTSIRAHDGDLRTVIR